MKLLYKSEFVVLLILSVLSGCKKENTTPTKLQAPSPELESVGMENAVIKWAAIDNATSYELFINSLTTVTAQGTSAVLDNLQPGTYYTVRMRAIPSSDNSMWLSSGYGSTLRFTTSVKGALSVPELKVDCLTMDSMTISWKAVSNADHYVVSLNDKEQDVQGTSFSAGNLTPETRYVIKVKAVPSEAQSYQFYESSWAEKEVVTLEKGTLASPQLSVNGISATGFKVEWLAVDRAGSYSVSITPGATSVVTDNFIEFTGLTEGVSYLVKVYAIPSEEYSGSYNGSSEASVTVVPRGDAGGDTSDSEDYIITEE